MTTKVMLETSVLKFSATKLERLIPIGEMTGVTLYEPAYINPNDRITNPEQKREAELLPDIADLAKRGDFQVFLDHEATRESWGVKKMNSVTGLFFDAPITEAEPPLEYGDALFGGGVKAKEWAKQFLIGIRDKRFIELAKTVGGYQGPNKYNLNQLRDAYYIWSSEHNRCEYMLTMDFNLIRMITRNKKLNVQVKLVRPSELLEQTGKLKQQNSS